MPVYYLELFSLLLFDVKPYPVGRAGVPADRAAFYAGGDLLEPRNRIIEELLIAFAEIALSIVVFIIPAGPVFHTSAPADIEVPAYEAFVA